MLKNMRPKKKTITSQGNSATYAIGPFAPEVGRALGNALRRVLLASLPGSAVTTIRIEGVQHEFQDIPNILEDVTDIVLNVKRLRLRSFSDYAVFLHLDVSGERKVTAADIIAPSTVEIANPELHLATLDNEQAHISMELVVEPGRGYTPAMSKEKQPIGVLPVDAIYTPVEKVGMTIQQTPGKQTTESEDIILTIITDGTITPNDAFFQAAEILANQFRVFATYQPGIEETASHGLSTIPIPPKIYHIPLAELDLSVRTIGALSRKKIHLVGQVLSMTEEDLLGVRNFGQKSLEETKEKFLKTGYLLL